MSFYKPKAICIAIINGDNTTENVTNYYLIEKDCNLYIRRHFCSIEYLLENFDVINLHYSRLNKTITNINLTVDGVCNFLGSSSEKLDIDWDLLIDKNTGLTKDIQILNNIHLEEIYGSDKKFGIHVIVESKKSSSTTIKPYIPCTIYGIKVISIKYLINSYKINSESAISVDLTDINTKYLDQESSLLRSVCSMSNGIKYVDMSNWDIRMTVTELYKMFNSDIHTLHLGNIKLNVDRKVVCRDLCNKDMINTIILNIKDQWIENLKQLDNVLNNSKDTSLLNYFINSNKEFKLQPLGNVCELTNMYEYEIGTYLRKLSTIIIEMESIYREQIKNKNIEKSNCLIGPLQMIEEIPRYGANDDFINIGLLTTTKQLITKSKFDKLKLKATILSAQVGDYIVIDDN